MARSGVESTMSSEERVVVVVAMVFQIEKDDSGNCDSPSRVLSDSVQNMEKSVLLRNGMCEEMIVVLILNRGRRDSLLPEFCEGCG